MKTYVLDAPVKTATFQFEADPILNPAKPRDSRELAALKDWCLSRANEWCKLGMNGPACDFLKHATEIDPQDTQSWIALGSLQYEMGEFEQAGLAFHRAAQQKPNNARIYLHLALTHRKLAHAELAEGLFEYALQLQPGDSLALSLLGDFMISQGRFDRARPCYEQLLQQRPDDTDALLRLGVCNFRVKEYSTARHCFERILRIDPKHEIARENLELLDSKAAVSR